MIEHQLSEEENVFLFSRAISILEDLGKENGSLFNCKIITFDDIIVFAYVAVLCMKAGFFNSTKVSDQSKNGN